MKRMIALMLAFAMVMTLTACGLLAEKSAETVPVTEEVPVTATPPTEAEPIITLEAKDCFYDAGFVEILSGADADAEYTFTAENSEGTEWWVYVLEEAFEEGFRYIKQITEPVLMGDGEIFVEAGKYVYVYCSSNEFTTGVADENAKLNIFVK